MPQLGEEKEKKAKKAKPASSKDEVVSAYSEEGKLRNKNKRKKDIAFFVTFIVVFILCLVLFFLFTSGIFDVGTGSSSSLS